MLAATVIFKLERSPKFYSVQSTKRRTFGVITQVKLSVPCSKVSSQINLHEIAILWWNDMIGVGRYSFPSYHTIIVGRYMSIEGMFQLVYCRIASPAFIGSSSVTWTSCGTVGVIVIALPSNDNPNILCLIRFRLTHSSNLRTLWLSV